MLTYILGDLCHEQRCNGLFIYSMRSKRVQSCGLIPALLQIQSHSLALIKIKVPKEESLEEFPFLVLKKPFNEWFLKDPSIDT